MGDQMAQLSQPSVTASMARWFGRVDASHGWLVNFVVVVALLGIGACFVSGRTRLIRAGVVAGIVLGLVTWVLVQDFGFLGGLGTDPNSMIPMALVFVAGYLAMVRLPVPAAAVAPGEPVDERAADPGEREDERTAVPEGVPVGASAVAASDAPGASGASGVSDAPGAPSGIQDVGTWSGRLLRLPTAYLWRSIAAIGAVGIVVLGAAPMALAAARPTADPIINQSANGSPNIVNYPAPGFSLIDQNGAPVSLAGLRGRTVILTFLDPTCTSDCPLIAQELRVVDQELGTDATHVALVAIVTNPLYTSVAATVAFDRQEGMGQLTNWDYLTGTLDQLHQAWNSYGVEAAIAPAGAMVAHSDLVFVIDPAGRLRVVLTADPGDTTDAALHSSFSATLTAQVRQLIGS
jgi:cytochrome oxidase Cu insertion factor (SCO1/SenC/PrrC family)